MNEETKAKFDYSDVKVLSDGHFTYLDGRGINCAANFSLHLIAMAWYAGCEMEDLADGFGAGLGTMGGDWSGIRDSSPEATAKMLERALNFIHGKLDP